MIDINTDTIEKIYSQYLVNFTNEKATYKNLKFGDKKLSIDLDVVGIEQEFHLSGVMAHVISSQLAIIYANLDNDLYEKDREVLLRDFSIDCKKAILDTEIAITVEEKNRRKSSKFIMYDLEITFNGGKFISNIKPLIPLSKDFSFI